MIDLTGAHRRSESPGPRLSFSQLADRGTALGPPSHFKKDLPRKHTIVQRISRLRGRRYFLIFFTTFSGELSFDDPASLSLSSFGSVDGFIDF
jgi:hypothetical protein